MLALALQEKETNSLGIPISVATDPANQFNFVTPLPTTDWSLQTLAADQAAYYKQHDTDKERPMNRAGHLWTTRLRDDDITQ